jgi:hypothetical protein
MADSIKLEIFEIILIHADQMKGVVVAHWLWARVGFPAKASCHCFCEYSTGAIWCATAGLLCKEVLLLSTKPDMYPN